MNQELKEEFLELLVSKGAVKIANKKEEAFLYKSGRLGPNFVNIGSLTDGESLAMLKKVFATQIKSLLDTKQISDFDFIFGPAYKGISLAALAASGLYEDFGINKRILYDRKEAKNYGDKASDQTIVGAGHFKPGSRVLIIDDVITTGGAKLDALEKLKALPQCKVAGIVIAVDRQEKMGDANNIDPLSATQAIERDFKVKTFSILSMQDIYKILGPTVSEEARKLWLDYYEKYGAAKLE